MFRDSSHQPPPFHPHSLSFDLFSLFYSLRSPLFALLSSFFSLFTIFSLPPKTESKCAILHQTIPRPYHLLHGFPAHFQHLPLHSTHRKATPATGGIRISICTFLLRERVSPYIRIRSRHLPLYMCTGENMIIS